MSNSSLLQALGLDTLDRPPQIALTGSGGKTTLLFALAGELAAAFPQVWLAAATHLGIDQAVPQAHVILDDPSGLARANPVGLTIFTGPRQGDRWQGLDQAGLDALQRQARAQAIPLLVEADGARQRPLKAHAAWEPPVPPWVEALVVVAGLAGLGRPLDDTSVHRPELFAPLARLSPGQPVTAEAVRRVLLDDAVGGLKNVPPGARRIAFLNQADTPWLRYRASRLAPHLLEGYARVLVAALHQFPRPPLAVYRPLAGIILAAGGASRFGQPKQLLPVGGVPAVRRAAQAALRAGLHPLRVVVGAYAAEVAAALDGLPLEIVANPAWQAGQSTSLRAGLSGLPPGHGGAIFLQADQPFVSAALLHALRRAHAAGPVLACAPAVQGQRTSPALFDSSLFGALTGLQGDRGGRALFERFPPALVPWRDARLLLDLDTPADYDAARRAVSTPPPGRT